MTLLNLFKSLDKPSGEDSTAFVAKRIPDYEEFRIANNSEGFPVLLFSVSNPLYRNSLQNFRLKYLQIIHNLECKITESGKSEHKVLSVITFRSTDKVLQEYFLKVAEPFIQSLDRNPRQEQIVEIFLRFIEIFRVLGDAPKKTVQGLWAELLLICNAKSPEVLIDYWHAGPGEKFDFNSGKEKVEVKSSSNFTRRHTFSIEQLSPLHGEQVLIASIFTRSSDAGKNVFDLIDEIKARVNNTHLVSKLYRVTSATLGSSIEQALEVRYDLKVALDSLKFFKHQDVKRIDTTNISFEVTEIRFKSDLINIPSVNPISINSDSQLFLAL